MRGKGQLEQLFYLCRVDAACRPLQRTHGKTFTVADLTLSVSSVPMLSLVAYQAREEKETDILALSVQLSSVHGRCRPLQRVRRTKRVKKKTQKDLVFGT